MRNGSATKTTTALTRYERDIGALENQYGNPDEFNFLVPRMSMSELPPGMRLIATRVDIDPESRDVYPIPGGNEVGIGKPKLNAIAAALGITWVYSKRIDDRKHPHYVEWEVKGRMVMPDGTVREESANKVIDMRSDIGDGTPGADLEKIRSIAKRKKRPADDEIIQVRQNIQSLAETKAKNRAIRSLAGLRTSYPRSDVRKPFVLVKPAVDPGSELGGRAALAAMYGATEALFGAKALPAPVEAEFVDEAGSAHAVGDEPADPSRGDEAAGAQGGSLPPAASEPDDVPPMPSLDQPVELTEDERTEELHKIWSRVAKAGMSQKAWFGWIKNNTGKAPRDLTRDDLEQLAEAAEAYVDAEGGQ